MHQNPFFFNMENIVKIWIVHSVLQLWKDHKLKIAIIEQS